MKDKKTKLADLAEAYLKQKDIFIQSCNNAVDALTLDDEQKADILFGLLEPSNPDLQEYCNTINSDASLVCQNDILNQILLEGNMIIIQSIVEAGITISGYPITDFIKNPQSNSNEIDNLVKSIGAYEHCHIINNKLLFEVPARLSLTNHKQIVDLADFWLKKLKVFA